MHRHLKSLRGFVAVVEELNFTAAAKRLHVAQPALSRQIQALESELGMELFERNRRTVSITEAGQVLLPVVRRMIRDFDHAVATGAAAQRSKEMVLRVGFASAAINAISTPTIQRFGQRHAGWRVTMVQVNWDDPTGGVASGRTDVAFVRLPMFDHAVTSTPLHTEPHQLAIPVDHKFADRDVIEFDEPLGEPFVAITTASGAWRDWWLMTHLRGRAEAIIGAEVETPDEWFAAISTGAGVAITPRSTAAYYTRPGIAFRALNGVPPSTAGIIKRRGDRRRIVDDFVSAAAECAEVGFDM